MAEMCPDCGASFESPGDLVNHVKTAHGGGDAAASLSMNPATTEPGYVCGLCGKSFRTASELAEHNLTRPERRAKEAAAHAGVAPG
jgi:hypothetical protein